MMENKYQKSLDIVKERIENITNYFEMEKDNEFYDSVSTLQELVDCATPKKPTYVCEDEPLCPNCRCVLDGTEEHCEECDQRLDWSD